VSYSIGELARRTGLTVKTIRYYSDQGIVAPAGRNPAGHRRYGADAAVRLDWVRTLRRLGLDLVTVRKVVAREISLAEVAAAHTEAIDVQIRTLRLRRAVLAAVAKRGSTPEEMDMMYRLAELSDDERRRLIDEFLGAAFGGVTADPAFEGIALSMTPELPDDPEPEQVEAWMELAELSQDRDFRRRMRQIAEGFADDRAMGVPRRDAAAWVRDLVAPALAADVDPAAPAADPIVVAVMARYVELSGRPDGAALRRRLSTRLAAANDPRRERYLALLSVINGWSAPASLAPALDWFVEALRIRYPDEPGA
jgi:DNA-binding transcriptional MerR regulator